MKISTISFTSSIDNCFLNLYDLANFITLGKELSFIKLKIHEDIIEKGKSKSLGVFNNQISCIFKDKHVKIFRNGTLQITGCKDTDDGEKISNDLYHYILTKQNNINSVNLLVRKDENGILIDSKNVIYSHNEKKLEYIGYYSVTKGLYWLYKTQQFYKPVNRGDDKIYLISEKNYTGKYKEVYSQNGNYVGNVFFKLNHNRKNIYLNDTIFFDYEKNFIKSNENIIGKIIWEIKSNYYSFDEDTLLINYLPQFFIELPDKFNFSIKINCINACKKVVNEINLSTLYNSLSPTKYVVKYNPDIYKGFKLVWKGNNDGICHCGKVCLCDKLTFLIFNTGNIICSGRGSIVDMNDTFKKIEEIILTAIKNEKIITF